jgi:hypothetical protein
MASAGSTSRGPRDNQAPVTASWRNQDDRPAGWSPREVEPCIRVLLLSNPGNSEMSLLLLPPSPTGTRKAAKPPLVCGFVATWQPKGQTESGRGQGTHSRTGGRAATEPRTSNAVLAGPEARRRPAMQSNGAAVVFPLVGESTRGPHTPSSVKQFKN